VNGTWFQLISNGITSINNGTNGLQKLDTVVRLAQKHNVFVILSLTNNWNPQASDSIVDRPISFEARDTTSTINATAQRNFLSNQYGPLSLRP
jgi:mannan endo-1,4-beta-mannosidase